MNVRDGALGALPRWGGLVGVVVITSLAVACESPSAPSEPPSVSGIVETLSIPLPSADGSAGSGPMEVREEGSSCLVTVVVSDETTILVTSPSGETSRGSWANLATGRSVRVWTRDPVSAECPRSGAARVVEVVLLGS